MSYEPRPTTTYRFDCYACDRDDNEIEHSLISVMCETDDLQDPTVIRTLSDIASRFPGHSVWSTLWRFTEGSRTCLQTSLFERG